MVEAGHPLPELLDDWTLEQMFLMAGKIIELKLMAAGATEDQRDAGVERSNVEAMGIFREMGMVKEITGDG